MASRKRPAAASSQTVTELIEYQLLRPYRIPMSEIRPAPVNPNRMSAAEMEATERSMLKYGFLKPGMVRHYDATDREDIVAMGMVVWLTMELFRAGITGKLSVKPAQLRAARKQLEDLFATEWERRFEIIDAHHRFEIVQRWIERGFPQGIKPHPSVVECVNDRVLPCTIHPMSRDVAKHMRLILTYGHGTPQELPAGQIAAELLRVMPLSEVLVGLPWTEALAQNYVAAASFDWVAHLQQVGEDKAKRAADKEKRKAEQFKITIVGPNDLREATMRLIADFAAQNPAVKVKQ